MNKVCGTIESYIPLREDASRIVIAYGMEALEDNINAIWYEIYIYKKQKPSITFDELKEYVLNDIDDQTDENILSGFVWTPAGGTPVHIWLSAENQRNFSEADRKAKDKPEYVLPIVFKLGEDAEKNPVYHTFETYEELDAFYMQAFAYINQCLNEGWRRKDSIDWNDYSVYFPVTNE